jgi:flagellar protein FlgJ
MIIGSKGVPPTIRSSTGVSPVVPPSSTGVSPVKPPASAGDTKRLADLKKACEQFEAVFAKKLLGEMRKGVQETPLGDSAGSEIYKDMMDQALADSMASQGSLGIAKMLYKQFENQVAAAISPPAAGAPISPPAPGGESEPKRAGEGMPAPANTKNGFR